MSDNSVINFASKICNLFEIEKQSLIESIDNKKGNVSKDVIKQYLSELTNLVNEEKLKIEKSDEITPTSANSSILTINNTNELIDSHINGYDIVDNRSNINEKFDVLFNRVSNLTSKVEQNNEILIREFEVKTQKFSDQKNGKFERKQKNRRQINSSQQYGKDRNFYPIYEKSDNNYRQQLYQQNVQNYTNTIIGKQLSQQNLSEYHSPKGRLFFNSKEIQKQKNINQNMPQNIQFNDNFLDRSFLENNFSMYPNLNYSSVIQGVY